jgi:long-chain acyl-CoA synthetase
VNLARALLATATTDPGRPALRLPERTVSHGELAGWAAAIADDLGRHAVAGQPVAIVAGNEAVFVAAYLGTLAAGGIAVPLNPSSPAAELGHELGVLGSCIVVTSPSAEAAARAALGNRECVVVPAAPPTGAAASFAAVDRESTDPAALVFTSGTAGSPRPAVLTHGSLLANLEQVQQHPGLALRADDVALGALPFFHIFGLNVVLGIALHAGASIAIVEHFHPADSVQRIRADGVTTIAAVPAIYDAWLALDDVAAPADAFRNVRLAVSGAAALNVETVDAMQRRFGVAIHEGYGLTEASPVVSTSAVDAAIRAGSIGPPLPGIDIRLVDIDGADVLNGDPGEIWVRGPNVFGGYWHDAEATQRVLTADGWLRTGDIAVADDDGWLTLVDRAKDLIIVSGFNVFPAEVEETLIAHPDIAEAAVIGVPHPRTGEAVVAYVVLEAGHQLDRRDLHRFAQERLARYKLPTRVEAVDALPRTFGGKIARRALADRAASERSDATAKPA